jgi:hypothetical protein
MPVPCAESNGVSSPQYVPATAAGAGSRCKSHQQHCRVNRPQRTQPMETKSDAAAAADCPTKAKVAGSATPWRQQQLACPTRTNLSSCCQHNIQQRTAALDAAPAGAVPPSLLGVHTKHQHTDSTAGPAAAAAAMGRTTRPRQQHSWAACLCLSGCRARSSPTAGATFFSNSSCRRSSRTRSSTCRRPAAAGISI